MISSYVGENAEFERQYLSGELEVELTPQVMKLSVLRVLVKVKSYVANEGCYKFLAPNFFSIHGPRGEIFLSSLDRMLCYCKVPSSTLSPVPIYTPCGGT